MIRKKIIRPAAGQGEDEEKIKDDEKVLFLGIFHPKRGLSLRTYPYLQGSSISIFIFHYILLVLAYFTLCRKKSYLRPRSVLMVGGGRASSELPLCA